MAVTPSRDDHGTVGVAGRKAAGILLLEERDSHVLVHATYASRTETAPRVWSGPVDRREGQGADRARRSSSGRTVYSPGLRHHLVDRLVRGPRSPREGRRHAAGRSLDGEAEQRRGEVHRRRAWTTVSSQPIYGTPSDAPIQYVGGAVAVAAAGNIERAMAAGVEIAQKSEAITGLPTMFGRSVTGPYGGGRLAHRLRERGRDGEGRHCAVG